MPNPLRQSNGAYLTVRREQASYIDEEHRAAATLFARSNRLSNDGFPEYRCRLQLQLRLGERKCKCNFPKTRPKARPGAIEKFQSLIIASRTFLRTTKRTFDLIAALAA
jgi:hypothetical protein